MPLVHIKSPELSREQKKRIGDRIISAFHGEGFPSGSVVVLFEREVADLLLDGGLLFEAGVLSPEYRAPQAPSVPVPAPLPLLLAPVEPSGASSRDNQKRSKTELVELKAELVSTLQAKGALSSFQAQIDLGLKACEWAPATLRRFFSELEEEGVISKQGQKRGTRYVWKGITSQQAAVASIPLLVKRLED